MSLDPEDPAVLRFNAQRLITRDIDQLLGICEFSLQDGAIDDYEARAIMDWLENHRMCLDTWPANVLFDRLRGIFSDGIIDDDEQRDLLDLIIQISAPRTAAGAITPSALPLNQPAPAIEFADRAFCFTGVFDFGSRNDCHKSIEQRNGLIGKGITKKLDYLVIGNIGSEAWKHSSFGNKILKAIDYRDQGHPIAIVSETHWTKFL